MVRRTRPELCLIIAIDDATNEIPWALFREEDAAGYFELLKEICLSHGLPQALYADRHTIFQQFGHLVDELGIELIPARSPQARGRVERFFGILHDRLVKELREAGASTLEQASQVLRDYLPKFNTRFSLAPAQPGSAYCPWSADPGLLFSFKHKRVVGNDNTISFDGHKLQIPLGPSAGAMPGSMSTSSWMEAWLSSIKVKPWSSFPTGILNGESANQGPVRVGKFTPEPPAVSPVLPSPVEPAKSKPQAPRNPTSQPLITLGSELHYGSINNLW